MALGIGGEPVAGTVDGTVLADAGHHIGQQAPLRHVIMDIVGGDQRCAAARRKGGQPGQPGGVVAAVEMARGEVTLRFQAV